jgi:wobble nucleotide-excising tRNase
MVGELQIFANLNALADYLRDRLKDKKYVLLYAYNGTGKTRLSMVFKDQGRNGDTRDTLYFNAFTEDLFTWDNDLDNDAQRVLRMNQASHFFAGLEALEMENRIRPFLHRYADFDFDIDYEQGTVNFSRDDTARDTIENIEHIKISRGEENIFIWCFFLAIAQLAIDEQEAYDWVKYLYIDDPISSLDDNNAIAVASHLAQLLKKQDRIKAVISSHHTLFFNVLYNELGVAQHYFLSRESDTYRLRDTNATPRFYHIAMLKELHEVSESGRLYTYHFTILRNVLEKTATFHGFNGFSACIRQDADDEDGIVHARLINVLNHGNYSLFEPVEMLEENKQYFRMILNDFMHNYRFNPELFPETVEQGAQL